MNYFLLGLAIGLALGAMVLLPMLRERERRIDNLLDDLDRNETDAYLSMFKRRDQQTFESRLRHDVFKDWN